MTTNDPRKELLRDWDELANRIGDVMSQRGEFYGGDPVPGFRSVGLIWKALLEDCFQIELPGPIPPSVVSAMMVGLKLSRLCRPGYNEDDAVDAIGYVHLADHCAKREISS